MYNLFKHVPLLKYPEHTYFGFFPPPLAIMIGTSYGDGNPFRDVF
jgi:hypothetical protein